MVYQSDPGRGSGPQVLVPAWPSAAKVSPRNGRTHPDPRRTRGLWTASGRSRSDLAKGSALAEGVMFGSANRRGGLHMHW